MCFFENDLCGKKYSMSDKIILICLVSNFLKSLIMIVLVSIAQFKLQKKYEFKKLSILLQKLDLDRKYFVF